MIGHDLFARFGGRKPRRGDKYALAINRVNFARGATAAIEKNGKETGLGVKAQTEITGGGEVFIQRDTHVLHECTGGLRAARAIDGEHGGDRARNGRAIGQGFIQYLVGFGQAHRLPAITGTTRCDQYPLAVDHRIAIKTHHHQHRVKPIAQGVVGGGVVPLLHQHLFDQCAPLYRIGEHMNRRQILLLPDVNQFREGVKRTLQVLAHYALLSGVDMTQGKEGRKNQQGYG